MAGAERPFDHKICRIARLAPIEVGIESFLSGFHGKAPSGLPRTPSLQLLNLNVCRADIGKRLTQRVRSAGGQLQGHGRNQHRP
jgi:hypothetical protein